MSILHTLTVDFDIHRPKWLCVCVVFTRVCLHVCGPLKYICMRTKDISSCSRLGCVRSANAEYSNLKQRKHKHNFEKQQMNYRKFMCFFFSIWLIYRSYKRHFYLGFQCIGANCEWKVKKIQIHNELSFLKGDMFPNVVKLWYELIYLNFSASRRKSTWNDDWRREIFFIENMKKKHIGSANNAFKYLNVLWHSPNMS